MVKGVNKNIIEVHDTKSAYFDRAILFVKPEYALFDGERLFREARKYVNNADMNRKFGSSNRRKFDKHKGKIKTAVCSCAAVVGTAVVCYFVF